MWFKMEQFIIFIIELMQQDPKFGREFRRFTAPQDQARAGGTGTGIVRRQEPPLEVDRDL